MEIITAGDGKAHVSSADDGMLYAGISGTGCYVHMTGNSLACRMETANKATVDTGSGFMFGRGFRFAAPESVTIQSGTQAQRRNDIIGIRFTTSTTGEESGRLEVIRGTPTSGATASDPPVPTSSMLDGATTGWMSLYRIRLDGISVSEPEPMFDVLAPLSKIQSDLAALRDSVSRVRVEISPIAVTYGSIFAEACGRVVVVHISAVGVKSAIKAWSGMKIAQLPTGYRPSRLVTAAVYDTPGAAVLQAAADGTVTLVARDTEIAVGYNIDGTLAFIAS